MLACLRLVANISDCGYVGPHLTVALMAPLLRNPAVNPHATLVTLFMNAVDKDFTDRDRVVEATENSQSTDTLIKYIQPTRSLTSEYDPALVKFSLARDCVTPYDRCFDR
jgi:hypothetical protein